MQTAGANELGYANTALLMALLGTLRDKGILSQDDLMRIVGDAKAELAPMANITSIKGAIAFIEAAVVPQVLKNTTD